MKTAAVICEFNPFHNGHKYLIDTIKKNHADCVVAVMSGSFVQRGDVAITDKYVRAKAALENGCDLVVELPTAFALSSAENFAQGGVNIAKALSVDMLCFGAEDADTQKLIQIADVVSDDKFCDILKKQLQKGEFYAKAVSLAVSEFLSPEHSEILSKPNNTLAIEYIKALSGSDISPVAIKRTGVDHDSDVTFKNIASATHIRSLVRDNKAYCDFTEMVVDNPADINRLSTAILYRLRTMSKEDIENLPDVNEGLHNRIYECARNSNSLEELLVNLKTKRYTLSRLRRIVMYALLGITKSDIKQPVQYVRVLGLNDTGAKVLKSCSLPVIGKVKKGYDALSMDAKAMFDIDVRASEIFALAVEDSSKCCNDFNSKIIKI